MSEDIPAWHPKSLSVKRKITHPHPDHTLTLPCLPARTRIYIILWEITPASLPHLPQMILRLDEYSDCTANILGSLWTLLFMKFNSWCPRTDDCHMSNKDNVVLRSCGRVHMAGSQAETTRLQLILRCQLSYRNAIVSRG